MGLNNDPHKAKSASRGSVLRIHSPNNPTRRSSEHLPRIFLVAITQAVGRPSTKGLLNKQGPANRCKQKPLDNGGRGRGGSIIQIRETPGVVRATFLSNSNEEV